jgi:hypothetical protein
MEVFELTAEIAGMQECSKPVEEIKNVLRFH